MLKQHKVKLFVILTASTEKLPVQYAFKSLCCLTQTLECLTFFKLPEYESESDFEMRTKTDRIQYRGRREEFRRKRKLQLRMRRRKIMILIWFNRVWDNLVMTCQ